MFSRVGNLGLFLDLSRRFLLSRLSTRGRIDPSYLQSNFQGKFPKMPINLFFCSQKAKLVRRSNVRARKKFQSKKDTNGGGSGPSSLL